MLGIGHLFRSLEICRALSDHEVVLVTGGPQIDAKLPEHVREVRLPDLQMNREFKGLFSTQCNATLDQIKEERKKRLFALLEREKPDVFLIELYPFGRKAFRFELDPVLQAINDKRLHCGCVVCSVRDILVEKEDRYNGMEAFAESYSLGPARVQLQSKDPRGWQEFVDQLVELPLV